MALLAATVGIFTLAGCSGDGEATADGMAAEETITPTASGPTAEETSTCEHPDGYALTYPSDWQTYAGDDPALRHHVCGMFGTAPMELPTVATSLPHVPIHVTVYPFGAEEISFEDLTRPEYRQEAPSRDVEWQEATVAGRPAVRVVWVSEAPEDMLPTDYALARGTESVDWYVDLSTDTAARVLIASAVPLAAAATGVTDADKSAPGATSIDSTAEVLDAIMASLTLTR